jgi:hypothetical protein
MLVSTAIKSSMRKLGLIASGETPSTNEYADGLEALQVMLRSWAAEKIVVFASTKESFTLVSGTYLYTWGTSGTFNSARPNSLTGAYILDSEGATHLVDLIGEARYRSISVKTTVSRPYALFFRPSYPFANVYLYPVPNTAESIYIDSFKAFTETSSFDSISSTLAFPANYEEALIYNLAVRLAPEFGKPVPVEVAAIAVSSYNRITSLNASNQVEPVGIMIPAGRPYGGGYSINSDSYR